jgi:hypothetical protein
VMSNKPIISFEGKVSKSGDRYQINIPKTLRFVTKEELVGKNLHIMIYEDKY